MGASLFADPLRYPKPFAAATTPSSPSRHTNRKRVMLPRHALTGRFFRCGDAPSPTPCAHASGDDTRSALQVVRAPPQHLHPRSHFKHEARGSQRSSPHGILGASYAFLLRRLTRLLCRRSQPPRRIFTTSLAPRVRVP